MDASRPTTSMQELANRSFIRMCGGQYLGCYPALAYGAVAPEALMCVANHAATTPYGFPMPGPATLLSGATFAHQGDAQVLLDGYAYSGDGGYVVQPKPVVPQHFPHPNLPAAFFLPDSAI